MTRVVCTVLALLIMVFGPYLLAAWAGSVVGLFVRVARLWGGF